MQDISRQADTWGTEGPVVRERELRTRKFALTNVTVTATFRSTLRIYEIDGRSDADVLIRIFSTGPNDAGPGAQPQPDRFLGERRVRLIPPTFPEREPGYVQIGDLNEIAPLGTAERLTVEIEPVSRGLRVWGFVSVTHNATQHVTTVTPQ